MIISIIKCIGIILLQIILQLTCGTIFPGSLTKTMFLYDILGLIIFGSIYLHSKHNKERAHNNWQIMSIVIILSALLETFIACLLNITAITLPKVIMPYIERMNSIGVAEITPLSFVVTIILTPILEECIYRGYILNTLSQFTKTFVIANIIQALLFGISHFDIIQGLYAFIMGLVLGFICKRCKGLLAPTLGHITFNFMGTVLVPVIFNEEDALLLSRNIMLAALSLCLICVGFMLLKKEKKYEMCD